jgi:hypothetical protein
MPRSQRGLLYPRLVATNSVFVLGILVERYAPARVGIPLFPSVPDQGLGKVVDCDGTYSVREGPGDA